MDNINSGLFRLFIVCCKLAQSTGLLIIANAIPCWYFLACLDSRPRQMVEVALSGGTAIFIGGITLQYYARYVYSNAL